MFIYQVVGVPDIRLANLIVYIPICANITQRLDAENHAGIKKSSITVYHEG